jgi:hypothetical protein
MYGLTTIGETNICTRYRILIMYLSSKKLVLVICLFLVAFKAAAGSIFIQSAIERAKLAGAHVIAFSSQQAHSGSESAGENEQVHTMYLMSHVTANISEAGITIFPPVTSESRLTMTNEVLRTQNIPDTAFKPPKF